MATSTCCVNFATAAAKMTKSPAPATTTIWSSHQELFASTLFDYSQSFHLRTPQFKLLALGNQPHLQRIIPSMTPSAQRTRLELGKNKVGTWGGMRHRKNMLHAGNEQRMSSELLTFDEASNMNWLLLSSSCGATTLMTCVQAAHASEEFRINAICEVGELFELGIQLSYLLLLLGLLGAGSFFVIRQVLVRRELDLSAKELQVYLKEVPCYYVGYNLNLSHWKVLKPVSIMHHRNKCEVVTHRQLGFLNLVL
uniref:Uncharacterized protein n=1 Tax=Kalanchoe fedtschenkoi TaxID=63787 RepID=A0A7N0ZWR3_KALFE